MQVFLSHSLHEWESTLPIRFKEISSALGVQVHLPREGEKIDLDLILRSNLVIGLETNPKNERGTRRLEKELVLACGQEKSMFLLMDRVKDSYKWEGYYALPLTPNMTKVPDFFRNLFPPLQGLVYILTGLITDLQPGRGGSPLW